MNLTISVSYVCGGNTSKCRPRTMEVLLIAETPSPIYAETAEHLLVFLAGGKRIVAPEPDWDSLIGSKSLPAPPNDLGVPVPEIAILHEFLNTSMPTSDILKLAQADTVKGELGITPFQFSHENILRLRLLASRLSPIATRKR